MSVFTSTGKVNHPSPTTWRRRDSNPGPKFWKSEVRRFNDWATPPSCDKGKILDDLYHGIPKHTGRSIESISPRTRSLPRRRARRRAPQACQKRHCNSTRSTSAAPSSPQWGTATHLTRLGSSPPSWPAPPAPRQERYPGANIEPMDLPYVLFCILCPVSSLMLDFAPCPIWPWN